MNEIELLTRVEPGAWNAEVVRLKGGPFHTYEWSQFSCENNRTEPKYIKWGKGDGAVEAIGLGQIRRTEFAGHSLLTSFSMGSFPAVTNAECLKESLRALIRYCQGHRIDLLQMHSFGTPLGTELLEEFEFQVEKRWEFIVAMDSSEDDLWKRLHTKKRNLIRKGQKEGLQVNRVFGLQDVMEFRALTVETYNRKTEQHVSFPKPADETYYRLLKERLMDTGLGRLYMAYGDERAISGSFFVGFNRSAYYMLSSASEEGLRRAAPDLTLWKAMTDYRKEGFHLFNLGGLSERELNGLPLEGSGLYHFKKRFSADVLPCKKGFLILRRKQFRLYSFLKGVKSSLHWLSG
jgi:hypothetical protein